MVKGLGLGVMAAFTVLAPASEAFAAPPAHAPAHGYRAKQAHRHGADCGHAYDAVSNRYMDYDFDYVDYDTRRGDRWQRGSGWDSGRDWDRNSRYRTSSADRYSRYGDFDRDGIPNFRDRDIDNDGIPNNRDRDDFSRRGRLSGRDYDRRGGDYGRGSGDFDRDGRGNRYDYDDDNDGRGDRYDRDDRNPYRR